MVSAEGIDPQEENYKHETNALAYTFKAGSWQI